MNNGDIEIVRALDRGMREGSFGWSLAQESHDDATWLVRQATRWDKVRAATAIEAFFEEQRGPR